MTAEQKQLIAGVADALEELVGAWPRSRCDVWACVEGAKLTFTSYMVMDTGKSFCGNGRTPKDAVESLLNKAGRFDPAVENRKKVESLRAEIAVRLAEIEKIEPVALAIVESHLETESFDASI